MRRISGIVLWVVLMVFLLAGCASSAEIGQAATAVDVPEAAAVQENVLPEETARTYENTLFDSSYVHSIDIRIAEADWEDLRHDSDVCHSEG